MAEIERRGCEPWGVEVNADRARFAQEHFHLGHVYNMSDDEFFKMPNLPEFDMITLFEEIEHLDNPREFVQNVAKLVKTDGMIVLSTPSRERIVADLLPGDYPPQHLTRWNEAAISNLFKDTGFKVSKVCYVDQFRLLLESFASRLRFRMMPKVGRFAQEHTHPVTGRSAVIVEKNILTTLARIGAMAKNYVVAGIPAGFCFLFGRLTGRKNGAMLVWLSR